MRKSVLVFLVVLLPLVLSAQRNVYKAAKSAYEGGDYEKAKRAIDQAVVHEKTKDNADSWVLKGHIYLKLLEQMDIKNGVNENPGQVAFDAYKKAKNLNKKSNHKEKLVAIASMLTDYGISFQMLRQYDQALSFFDLGIKVKTYLKEPVGTIYSLKGSVLVAQKDYLAAAEAYMANVAQSFQPEQSAVSAVMALNLAESPMFSEKLIQYRTQFPNNQTLMNYEVDYHINRGDLDKAEALLSALVSTHPTSIIYLAQYGSVLIQKDDSTGIVHLERALEMEPQNLFARKEAGRFYMMEGVKQNALFERAQAAEDASETKFKGARDLALGKMTVHYEKVIQIDPKDKLTLQALMNVYGLMQDETNYKRIIQLMEALKNHP